MIYVYISGTLLEQQWKTLYQMELIVQNVIDAILTLVNYKKMTDYFVEMDKMNSVGVIMYVLLGDVL